MFLSPSKKIEIWGYVVKSCFSEGIFTGSLKLDIQAKDFLLTWPDIGDRLENQGPANQWPTCPLESPRDHPQLPEEEHNVPSGLGGVAGPERWMACVAG